MEVLYSNIHSNEYIAWQRGGFCRRGARAPRALTGFLRRSGEAAFDGATVRVVAAADAASVLRFAGADLSVAADFLGAERNDGRGQLTGVRM